MFLLCITHPGGIFLINSTSPRASAYSITNIPTALLYQPWLLLQMYDTQRHFVACRVTVIFVLSCLTHYYIITLSCPRSDFQYLHTSISGGSLHSKCIPSRHIEKCTCSHKSKMAVCSYVMLTPVDTHPVTTKSYI